ncbi:MAG: glycosyltransferase family 2 protein [Candidatus Caldarchaeum sp.]|nr:glycosyltransferase family 2 protein [Candidatus Caldarchaeum sp.]
MLEGIVSFGVGLFIAAWLVVFLQKLRILNSLEKLDNLMEISKPKVSAVIPARNEEKTIGRCIDTLLRQRNVLTEVVVVDDNSTDRTWEVVQDYVPRGVKAVKSGSPPQGWVGKTWACNVGYRESTGDWILFTDADTHFSEDLIALAVSKAEEKGAELITLYPRLRFNSVLHKLSMPILLTGFYLFGRPHMVSSKQSAFAFGSFILFKRSAYERIGGHSVVKNALLEDRAIALRAVRAGVNITFAKALDRLTSSWNDDSKSLWNGMLRIFIPLTLDRPVKQTFMYVVLVMLCLAIPPVAFLAGNFVGFLASYLTASVVLGHEARVHSASFLHGFLWYAGAVAVSAALITSIWRSARKPWVSWRGRRYTVQMGELHEAVVNFS